MDRYWAKIGFGALAIFGIGMTGVTLAKKGVHELKTAAMGEAAQILRHPPTDLLNFRLDGRRIGQVKSVEVSNEGEWTAKSVAMKVQVITGREPDDLSGCSLAAEDFAYRKDAAFRCVTKSEIDDEGLVQIGEVTFAPANLTRPLFIAEREVRKLAKSDLRGLKATLTSDDGKRVTGNARYDLQTDRGRERGTVVVDAGDGRANIEIRGDDGRELFRLRADDHGVSINAKDKRGSNLLRLLAGEAGVHLDVKSDDLKAEKDKN
jgi:hypothetical protein